MREKGFILKLLIKFSGIRVTMVIHINPHNTIRGTVLRIINFVFSKNIIQRYNISSL